MAATVHTLGEMRVGDQVKVVAIEGNGDIRWRMMALGLVAGTIVEVLRFSPMGDPVLYRFRGTTIALRKADADLVRVHRLPAKPPGKALVS